jgi:small subunit ribosomal protein S20
LQNLRFQVKLRAATGIVLLSEELKLANTDAAKKEIRKNLRRRQRNRLVRAKTRTVTKRAIRAIEDGDSSAQAEIRQAQIELDSAAAKGVIHKNAAARKKSRLAKRLRAAQVPKK